MFLVCFLLGLFKFGFHMKKQDIIDMLNLMNDKQFGFYLFGELVSYFVLLVTCFAMFIALLVN